MNVNIPKQNQLYELIKRNYFFDNKYEEVKVKDIDTLSSIHCKINSKYEDIKKRILFDIYTIIESEKQNEINSVCDKIKKLFI